jgi:hypothetical protein
MSGGPARAVPGLRRRAALWGYLPKLLAHWVPATIHAARTLADPSATFRQNALDANIEGEGPWVDELLRWLDREGALIDRAIWAADQALDVRERFRTRNGPHAIPPWVTPPDGGPGSYSPSRPRPAGANRRRA